MGALYSEVSIRHMPAFRMGRYVMITTNPEDDVYAYLDSWAEKSGLKAQCPDAVRIGWDFPFVTQEQQERFGLRGYAAAWMLPEGFDETIPGVEYAGNAAADYAVITIYDPFIDPFARIPGAYWQLMHYLEEHRIPERKQDDIIECFEHVYEKDGVSYMDVYLHADC